MISAGALVVGASVVHLGWLSRGKGYSVTDAPARDVAIVLGARVYDNGKPSPFLRARLDLALALYRAGKVKVVLVSGGNSASSNHETDVMVAYLVASGVPAGKVVADPKGYDTYESCVRARQVFGIKSAIVVTQGYHLPRAIALCSGVGIDAVGVGDNTRRKTSKSWRNGQIREWFASVKAEWNLTVGGSSADPYDPAVDRALGR